MRKQRSSLSEAIGTDAFLDIVANLVGILLIFLMVIGVRMEDASKAAAQSELESISASTVDEQDIKELPPLNLPEIEIPDSTEAELELSRLKSGIRDANRQAEELARLMQAQKLERDHFMMAIANAEVELEKRRTALDDSKRSKVAADMELYSP